jgi:shikimate kinase
MGSGKTSLANMLAERLHSRAVDLDEEITRSSGRSPAEIIQIDGEERFRKVETEALRQVLNGDARVIALGGGAWTIPVNRKLIDQCDCLTVWLDVDFDTCWERISTAGGNRPLAPNQQQAKALYHKRQRSYELAQLRIEVSAATDTIELARQIESALEV